LLRCCCSDLGHISDVIAYFTGAIVHVCHYTPPTAYQQLIQVFKRVEHVFALMCCNIEFKTNGSATDTKIFFGCPSTNQILKREKLLPIFTTKKGVNSRLLLYQFHYK
jgi:hypothetical protein